MADFPLSPGSPIPDAGHRLLHLVPVPTLRCGAPKRRPPGGAATNGYPAAGYPGSTCGAGHAGLVGHVAAAQSPSADHATTWEAGYALSPATTDWSMEVRKADPSRPALAVGFVGATSAGKSWLVGKLQSEGGAKPGCMEDLVADSRGGASMLQSITSDVNLYTDPAHHTYHVDFEGTYGTQPLQLKTADICRVVQRCVETEVWEHKRRSALKESVQPAVAYLMCNVVVFVTREKLVCRRTLEEMELFAMAANARVSSALPPALVIVQNCCRPSEGIFDTAECTKAFRDAHLNNGMGTQWAAYFRSIDCFCLPDEYTFCKRSGFDGEAVCVDVIASLQDTMRKRLTEGVSCRAEHDIVLSQLQWFSALSTLCSVINEGQTVEMTSICVDAASTGSEVSELRSALLRLMHPCARRSNGTVCQETFVGRLDAAIGIIARYVVRHNAAPDELLQMVTYLLLLFPCGAIATRDVERFDGSTAPVACGQSGLFHKKLHRSSTLVRTVEATWLQGMSEWLQGGVTHAWDGEFVCDGSVADKQNAETISVAIREQIEEYKLQKCLAGFQPTVGAKWILKARKSIVNCGLLIRRDPMRMCIICTARGEEQAGIFKVLQPQVAAGGLPVCSDCYNVLAEHGLCGKYIHTDTSIHQVIRCAACVATQAPGKTILGGLFGIGAERRTPLAQVSPADHRLRPCRCVTCRECAELLSNQEHPYCPLCDIRVLQIVDERALNETGWYSAMPDSLTAREPDCLPMCASNRRLR